MHLYLSAGSPWDTSYCTEEGQVIYKVKSHWHTFGVRMLKISRIIPSTEAMNEEDALRDTFAHLGEIEYCAFRTSRIRYGGQDIPVNEYFRKGDKKLISR